ncbi:MAG: winged helix-turn-helix domain-containing protein [Endomicrobium sp.]|jgi:transposase|nr:winged helix-turn-helix domain-containing protein [Endomicrobium sp.]
MARTITFTEKELKRAKELRDNHSNEREYRAALIVLLKNESDLTREQIAGIFGIDIKTVYSDMESIRNPAVEPKGEWGGGNNRLMSFEEEEQFLNTYLDDAKSGFILTIPKLHNEYNLLVGKTTPKSTIYRILERHNWRKVLPDTRHPKGDPVVQEEFKKKLSKWKWVKL